LRSSRRILLFIIFLLIKLNIFFITFSVLNGHWGNDQLKSGHEGYSWGTDGETIGLPDRNQPRDSATPEQQLRTAADKEASVSHDLKDVMPPSSPSLPRFDMEDAVYLADETSLQKIQSERRREIVTQPADGSWHGRQYTFVAVS